MKRGRRRTFLLGLSLKKFELSVGFQIKLDDSCTATEEERKAWVSSFHASPPGGTRTHIDGSISVSFDEIRVHLVSLGLLVILWEKIRKVFRVGTRRTRNHPNMGRNGSAPNGHGNHHDIRQVLSNESEISAVSDQTNTDAEGNDASSSSQPPHTPLYIIHKFIGGGNIVGFRVNTTASFRGGAGSKNGKQDAHLKWSLRSRHLTAELTTNKANGRADVIFDVGNLKTRLRSGYGEYRPSESQSSHDYYHHSIQVKSVRAAIGLSSSPALEKWNDNGDTMVTIASIRVMGMEEAEKDGLLDVTTSCSQMMSLATTANDWIWPLVNVFQTVQCHKQKIEAGAVVKARSKEDKGRFFVNTISLKLNLSATLRDGRTLEDSCSSDPLRLSTLVEFDMSSIPMKRMLILLSTTRLVKMSPFASVKENDVDLLRLDDVQISTGMGGGDKHLEPVFAQNLIEIDLGDLLLDIENEDYTEQTVSLLLNYQQAISLLVPTKPKKQNTISKKNETAPNLALTCTSCIFNVSAFAEETVTTEKRRQPISIFAKVVDLSVQTSTFKDGTTKILIDSGEAEASLAFVPHATIPTYDRCAKEVCHDYQPDSNRTRNGAKSVKFLVTLSKYHMFIQSPTKDVTAKMLDQRESTLIQISNVVMTEYLAGLSTINAVIQNELVRADGIVQVSITKEKKDGEEHERIEVQTLCRNISLLWSPVLQWYIGSAIRTIKDIIFVHLRKKSVQTEQQGDKAKQNAISKSVLIDTKDAIVQARVALAGASIVDITTIDINFSLTNHASDTWDKPDILVEAGRTGIKLNDSVSDVFLLDSIRYFNGIRRATQDEIDTYISKRSEKTALCDEIVSGRCGTPLVETVEIGANESLTLDLPPTVDFGAVIEDITTSLEAMDDGMVMAHLASPKEAKRRKYQLMNISLEIPILDVHFLEAASSIHNGKNTRFGKPRMHDPFLDRWRFLIKGFNVKIRRHTPPEVTQNQLRSLDEDKTRNYVYGPMVQGGEFHIGFDRVINTLHPLNLVTPLGDITNWQIKGLLYLAPLSPKMKYFIDGRKTCIPVKCHHLGSDCGCDYAVSKFSRGIPVKIYYDLNLTSDYLHSTYGDIIQPSIEGLMDIIKRLIPKPPLNDPRDPAKISSDPDLTWWDNLRFQFHGAFKWKMKKFSFRWLLDTVPRYDWSILLTSDDFILSHSTGVAALEMTNAIISLPDSSYHMLDSSPVHNGYSILQNYLKNNTSGFKRRRHHLILFPNFKTQFGFKWSVNRVPSEVQRNHSSRHHNVYMTDMLATPASKDDKFQYFRSQGWDIEWSFELDETQHGSWIALRGDVLPWITHKSPRPIVPSTGDEEDALPRVNGIQINVNVTRLNIGAWFDEKKDCQGKETEDESLEGIFLQIPKLQYSRSKKRGTSIDLYGPIQAALSEIAKNYDAHLATPPISSSLQSKNLLYWKERNHQRCYYEINDVHSLLFFDSLQSSAKKIRSLDYLLKVDQIKILDTALEDICADSKSTRIFNIEKEEAPWSVLVAGMKLLWTINIRDSVIAIVKDILFAINFMQVNSRGTPQLLDADVETGNRENLSDEENDNQSKANQKGTDEDDSDESAIEVIVNDDAKVPKEVDIIPVSSSPSSPAKPKSHLDHLLSRNDDSFRNTPPPVYQNSLNQNRQSLYKTVSKTDLSGSKGKVTPTFGLHLTNPQIQFFSEKTGGSIIIGIRGAYIEGKKFINLLAKNEAYEKNDIRLETLFRRTEFVYTLDRFELFSLSNSVDVGVGLQWLSLDHDTGISKSAHSHESSTYPDEDEFDDFSSLDNDNDNDRTWIFPKELHIFNTKPFTIPLLGKSIMNPSTFKTRQEFHRPPIDLTKEELEDVINQNLISPLELDRKNAIDYLEFFIDELSFHLDSHQFSTTLDVVRNTMLEPQKHREERYYQKSNDESDKNGGGSASKLEKNGDIPKNLREEMDESQFRKEIIEKSKKSKAHYDSLTFSLQKLLQEREINPKKWRELLRSVASELVVDLEDRKGPSGEPSARLIEYNLCKAVWKIAGEDLINDAEINFTDLKGIHDFSADGSVSSKISLENMHVTSHKPCSDAMRFPDPTIIVKTVLGEKRSPCQRCGLDFDRGSNEINSCRFHPGSFQLSTLERRMKWTCCAADDATAKGCVSRPHTGAEKAMDLQFDAFPRVVEGITLYKFIEANVYPGLSHTTIVQLTRSLTKSFMNYFLGDTDGVISVDTKEMLTASQTFSRSSTLESSSTDSTDVSFPSQVTPGFDPADLRDSRRFLLFGETGVDDKTQSPFELQQLSLSKSDKDKDKADKDDKDPKDAEIVFLRNWNIGDINIKLSIAGFHKIIDVSNVDLVISGFQRRYKIGSVQHLVKKFLAHLIKNLLSSSIGILKVKFTGGRHMTNRSRALTADSNLEVLEEEHEGHAPELAVENLLLAPPKTKQKKKRGWLGRKRSHD